MTWTFPHGFPDPYVAAEDGARDGIEYVDDHADQAVELLLEQFRDSERLHDLLRAYVAQIEDLERVLWDMLTLRSLDDATGAQLDGLGRIAAEPRSGRSDADYRAAIRVRLLILRSNGTLPEILRILSLVAVGAETGSVYGITLPPGSALVEIREDWTVGLPTLQRVASAIAPGGVRLDVLTTEDASAALTFGALESESSSTQGFADSALTVGGYASGVVTA